MVQIGSNLNVPKTVCLTSAAQVGKTSAVDNSNQPKVKTKAVWIKGSTDGTILGSPGDVYLTINARGEQVLKKIRISNIQDTDYQENRGDIRNPNCIW